MHNKKRALVLDNDFILCKFIPHIFATLGYEAHTARINDDILKICREANPPYSIILIDMFFPGKKDIFQLERELSTAKLHGALVITSGFNDNELMRNPRNYGFCTSLVKPFSKEEFAEMIQSTEAWLKS